jgi:HSP90 family molecular chaperone
MSDEKTTSYEFQSEVQQLLHILVYSLYKNKEVFLRELLSNAADALNKAQFESLTGSEVQGRDLELKISIEIDKKRNVLVVEDSGVGMTREELVANIGTIAHSGTLDYLKKVAAAEKPEQVELIGKFGVGFYSSFMVAKEIRVTTRSIRPEAPAWLWTSAGENTYSIEPAEKETRGTRIELLLKKDEKEFLDKDRLRRIILHHSTFLPFPIFLDGEKLERRDAIWTQPKAKLKDEDYVEFYKFLDNAAEEPATWLHLSSDAPVQFHALLYVPKTSFELLGFAKAEPGVDLYSRKVLIQKGCKDVMPDYLRFVKGVVDSEEIPLNISRETIQNNAAIDKIRRHLLKKLFEHLTQLKEKQPESYRAIWNAFGRHLKEGIIADYDNRSRLAELLLFSSSRTVGEERIDLAGYLKRMKPEQADIYTAAGLSAASIAASPSMEIFRQQELEVLYLLEPIDELAVDHLHEYEKKRLKSVDSADLKLGEKKPETDEAYARQTDSFVTYLKTVYGEAVQDVRLSARLVESPCLLAQPGEGPSAQMEKIIQMVDKGYRFARRILEINPGHALIRSLISRHQKDPADPLLKELALQMLDNLLLRENMVGDLEAVVGRMQAIMLAAAGKE